MNCIITNAWSKTIYALRPTTEVQPHEVFALMALGYFLGSKHSGEVDPQLMGPLGEAQASIEPVEADECVLTGTHKRMYALQPSLEVSPAQAFRALLIGFSLGSLRHEDTVLSDDVLARLALLQQAEDTAVAEVPVDEAPGLSEEQQARIAALRARQAVAVSPLPVAEPVSLIPSEIFAPPAPPAAAEPAPLV